MFVKETDKVIIIRKNMLSNVVVILLILLFISGIYQQLAMPNSLKGGVNVKLDDYLRRLEAQEKGLVELKNSIMPSAFKGRK